MQCLDKAELQNKSVLVRVDYNVPLDDNLNITSTKRIDATMHTIDYLLKQNCKIVLCSHLGRPQGKVDSLLSLKPVYEYLKTIYGDIVFFCSTCIGDEAQKSKKALKNGEILLLENLRFDAREEQNSEDFAKDLAKEVDVYVDEAFAVSHRQSASNCAIKNLLPCYIGFNYDKEIQALTLKDKKPPILAILGGAKVSDKIELISSLIDKVDAIFIGGALANTFLYALGYNVNTQTIEQDKIDVAKSVLQKALTQNKKIVLPQDVVVLCSNGEVCEKGIDILGTNDVCYDIGEKSVQELQGLIDRANTIFWNGPLGNVKMSQFAKATQDIIYALADSKAYTIIGGGDTIAEVEKYNMQDKMNFVSTGGGASLKYIQRG